MKKWKICLFSFVILVAIFVLVSLVPCKEVYASDDFLVIFDYNADALSENLMDGYRALTNESQFVEDGGYVVDFPSAFNSEILKKLKNYYYLTWTLNGDAVNPNECAINSNTTFVAKWEAKKYKIFYENLPYEKEYDEYSIESGRINYFRPYKDHYIFLDWCTTSYYNLWTVETYRPAGSIGDVILYAHWLPREYSITYHTDAENKYNPVSYNIESADIRLIAPTKEGHQFKGWYLDPDCTQSITTITKGSYGDIDLYAKWQALTYKVTYTLPDGTKQVVMCEYGQKADLPEIKKSIFEIVQTDVSRENITGNTKITIKLHNIWYLYVLGVVVIAGVLVAIVFAVKKNKERHIKLRYMYHSNARKR